MTAQQAEREYMNMLKLCLNDDGTVNEEGSIDVVIVGDMLKGLPPPTKAQVLERWRQSELRYAGKTDEEMAIIYEETLQRKH
jgi:hypothetical protein